jgi:glycosyltransferase involved in cell wall biosynthesis
LVKVSAIISTYNSSSFLEECIKDLLNQSLYKSGNIEIVVVDSGSNESEDKIVECFQNHYSGIKYIRTQTRESLYQAWNRGIVQAAGTYITNANTDDRHHSECLERLVYKLDGRPDCDVAYGNLYKSAAANETFDDNDKSSPCYSQKFNPGSLLLHDFTGAQPVWRKSLHDKIGLFDESFEVVGDYEFFLRAASEGCKFIHEPRAEGIMLWHQGALSTRDSKGVEEKNLLFEKYRNPKKIIQFYKKNISSEIFEPNIDSFLDLGTRSLCYFPQFASNNPQFDFNLAKNCFGHYPDHPVFEHNLSSLDQVSKLFSTDNEETHIFYGSRKKLPSEYELKQVAPTYFKKVGMEKFHGEYRGKFVFNTKEFFESLYSHLPIQNLTQYTQVCIFGYNERGVILGKYLANRGYNNIKFVDNYFGKNKNYPESSDFEIFSLEDLNPCMNSCFILAMSSHHWKTVEEDIKCICPLSTLFYLDPY